MKKLKNALSFAEFRSKKLTQFETEKALYLKTQDPKKLLIFKDIGRGGSHSFLREGWELFEQKNMHGKKAFVVEKIRKVKGNGKFHHRGGGKPGSVEYRIGYFIVTPKNRWWWGQSCPFVPREDVPQLIKVLRKLSK